jgi:hypothetical protein
MKCRRCDFEGTQNEVDDHFVSRIETGDLDHVRMARLGTDTDLPDDFGGQRSMLGECLHANAQLIQTGLGYVTYCRDCRTVANSAIPPECTCGAPRRSSHDLDGNPLHQPGCPYYKRPLWEDPNWVEYQALRQRRIEDPEFAERERREQLEQSKIDGKQIQIHVKGAETTVFVDGEVADPDQLAQEWGDCICGYPLAPRPLLRLAHPPDQSHRADCPRYRERPG